MRWLALDHGTKRLGLALCDPGEFLITPHAVWAMDDPELMERLKALCESENVEALCVGEPVHHDGNPSATAEAANQFADKVQMHLQKPMQRIGEHLTSVAAEARLKEWGIPSVKWRDRLDAVAAMIILEDLIALRRQRQIPLDAFGP